jgi:hypothetical protein
VEGSQDSGSQETRKRRLHNTKSIPSHFPSKHVRKIAGSGHGETSVLLRRGLPTTARYSIRRAAWADHRTSLTCARQWHRSSTTQEQNSHPHRLRPERGVQWCPRTTLDARLRERRIPVPAREWIRSFTQDRTASIQFDGYETAIEPLLFAGLAQGSPLSQILFAFYNADLVDQPVDTRGGASAYIDDYFRWRVGKPAEENLQKIQNEDIPRITTWAGRVSSRKELIHLTRTRKDRGKGSVQTDGQTIRASTTAKLLGVVFDTEMRWKEHVNKPPEKPLRPHWA